MTMLSCAAIAAACIATAAPAAVIYQATVVPGEGETVATLSGSLSLPAVLTAGTTWVKTDAGPMTAAQWMVDGLEWRLWWEDLGPDEDGNPVPNLTGNEYIYAPVCSSDLGNPVCASPVLSTDMGFDTLEVAFAPPAGFDFCTPFPGFYIDCHASYEFYFAYFDISVASVDGRPVTFTFYDRAPVPEPASWALMIAGFALTGTALRQRRRAIA